MAVERNKDGSITIKNNNSTTVIGKIIEASVKRKGNFQQWVENCAKSVAACPHTLNETEQYFLGQCDALPLARNDRRIKGFQLNVVMNCCKDKLEHQASEFSFDMTDEEIEKWHEENSAMRQEAMNTPPEQLGLNIRGYCLPHTERNKVFYEQAYEETQKLVKNTNQDLRQIDAQDICFFFEETTGHIQAHGGGRSLMQQLTIFRGISEYDIEKRTPRFFGYITTLREIGELDDSSAGL